MHYLYVSYMNKSKVLWIWIYLGCWKIHMLHNVEWSSFYMTLILGVYEIAGSI